RHLPLEQGKESACGGDGAAARCFQLLRRVDEGLEEGRVLLVDDALGRRSSHDAEPHGEVEGGGIADVARDAREDRVQGEDTYRFAVVASTASNDRHDRSNAGAVVTVGDVDRTRPRVRRPAG